ncbi:hypothetical protein CDAR_194161 [Caerostris darwini]|uniref:Uncharacterized protein n=1 Tax=Caerostris darwini TaxID=1538125 RepID=A0AAV4Q390_9ARAC|nr:hypothetical protein CDAR_194161 [Caerostris darwini]
MVSKVHKGMNHPLSARRGKKKNVPRGYIPEKKKEHIPPPLINLSSCHVISDAPFLSSPTFSFLEWEVNDYPLRLVTGNRFHSDTQLLSITLLKSVNRPSLELLLPASKTLNSLFL